MQEVSDECFESDGVAEDGEEVEEGNALCTESMSYA